MDEKKDKVVNLSVVKKPQTQDNMSVVKNGMDAMKDAIVVGYTKDGSFRMMATDFSPQFITFTLEFAKQAFLDEIISNSTNKYE